MIRLGKIFQDGMLLQRHKPIRIWGKTNKAQTIRVFIKKSKDTILISENEVEEGNFEIYLKEQEAAENVTMIIKGSLGDEIILNKVDIGEIWIAGGQSNMEFFLRYDVEGKETIAKANDEHIRYYNVAQYAFAGEEAERLKDDSRWERWFPYKPEYIETFSAVGLYFANQIRKVYGIPVGIVGCNWGGTTASAWMDERLLEEDEDLKIYLEEYEKATENLDIELYVKENRKAREGGNNPIVSMITRYLMEGRHKLLLKILNPVICSFPPAEMGPHNENRPGGLYHSMVSKIRGFTCQGVLWYQGESDDYHASIYAKLFAALIGCWRRDWKDETMPFLFVQLAPFSKWCAVSAMNYPTLRQQQEQVSKTVSNTWMVSIMDLGMEMDIHPKQKRPVGQRLALLARAKVYGEDILCEAPTINREKSNWENDTVTLVFEHCGTGLQLRGKKLNALKIIVDGKEIHNYKVHVELDKMRLTSTEFFSAKTLCFEYAWEQYCEVNLYNSAELSAKPFTWEVIK